MPVTTHLITAVTVTPVPESIPIVATMGGIVIACTLFALWAVTLLQKEANKKRGGNGRGKP